jgi:hypothetical protein
VRGRFKISFSSITLILTKTKHLDIQKVYLLEKLNYKIRNMRGGRLGFYLKIKDKGGFIK